MSNRVSALDNTFFKKELPSLYDKALYPMPHCPRCLEEKPKTEFYNSGNVYCKPCVSQKSTEWYLANKQRKSDINRGWRKRHSERRRIMQQCANAFHKALKNGQIIRGQTCTFCSATENIEGAHTDYSKPLDVIWLCRKCHRLWDHQSPKTF